MPIKRGDTVAINYPGTATRGLVVRMPDNDDEYLLEMLDGEYAGGLGDFPVEQVEALT